MKRLRFRFSLRSLLVLVTVCVLASGTFMILVRSDAVAHHREQQTLAELREHGSASIIRGPRGPAWLQKWRDRVYSYRAIKLAISSRALSEEYFAKLNAFEYLESLSISNGNSVSEEALSQLTRITTLRRLSLNNTHVHDSESHALRQLRLEQLTLSTDRFGENEANWIKDLEDLQHLELYAPVTDSNLGSLAELPNLEELVINSDGVTDAGLVHLARFHNLRRLKLLCPVSDEGMVHLIPLKSLDRLYCRPEKEPSQMAQDFQPVDKLFTSVRAKYYQAPLVDVVKSMSKMVRVAIRIDHAALQAVGMASDDVKLTADESGDLRQALEAMLTPHGLACIGEPDGLLITTEQEAARKRPGTTQLLKSNPHLKVFVPW
jgi:hypothetical protein